MSVGAISGVAYVCPVRVNLHRAAAGCICVRGIAGWSEMRASVRFWAVQDLSLTATSTRTKKCLWHLHCASEIR